MSPDAGLSPFHRGRPAGLSLSDKVVIGAYIVWTVVLIKLLLATAAPAKAARPGTPEVAGTPYYVGLLMESPAKVLAAATATVLLLWLAWRAPSSLGPGLRWAVAGVMAGGVFIGIALVHPTAAGRVLIAVLGACMFLTVIGAGRRVVGLVLGDGAGSIGRAGMAGCSAAAGLGLSAVAVLGLAAAGLATRWVFLSLLAAGAFEFRVEMRRTVSDVTAFLDETSEHFDFAVSLSVVLVGLIAAGTLISAFLPPADYDVLEYHLALPREYLHSGTVGVLDHNAYSGMPLASEMLSLMAMAIIGRPVLEGAYLAKVIVVLTGLAAALPVYAIAARLAGRRAGAVAAVAVLWSAGTVLLLARAYAEPLLTLQATAAFFCAIAALSARGDARLRRLVLAGLLAGLAAGTKYTAYAFVAAPVFLAILGFSLMQRRGAKGVLADLLAFGAPCAVAALPWIVRSLVSTGEPFYPLGAARLGLAGWTAERGARFVQAHDPGGFSLKEAAKEFAEVFGPPVNLSRGHRDVTEHHMSSAVMALFAPFALLYSARRRRGGLVWFFAAAWLIGWFCLTHRIPRFAFPALALTSVLAGVGYAELASSRLEKVVAGGFASWVLVTSAGVMGASLGLMHVDVASGRTAAEAFLGGTFGGEWKAYAAISGLPEGSRVLLVGEAKVFYLPPGRARYRTVFDGAELGEVIRSSPTARSAARELSRRGYTHIYFNWPELQRLESTYAFRYGGRDHGGYADFSGSEWLRLRNMVAVELQHVWSSDVPVGPNFGRGDFSEAEENWRWSRSWSRPFFRPGRKEKIFALYRLPPVEAADPAAGGGGEGEPD